MIKIFSYLIFPLLLLNAGLLRPQSPTPQLLLINGKIFTALNDHHFVEALAIQNGQIVSAGETVDLQSLADQETEIIDLQGRLVLPGFHDAHLHFWKGALLEHQLNLKGIRSKEEVLEKVKLAVGHLQPGEWLVGRGWDHELWASKQLPTRLELDKIAPDNPVYLKRVDGHAAWVNRKVLQILGYHRQTPDPPGGKIGRFPENGQPDGILIDTAYDPIDLLLPPPAFEIRQQILKNAIYFANSLGITSITDNSDAIIFENYASIFSEEPATLRVNFWIDGTENLDSLRNWFESFGCDERFLHVPLVKFFADGSLGSRSAYLFQPYADDPANTGLPQHSAEELYQLVQSAAVKGWQIGIHAIGDAGNRLVLDVYQQLQQQHPATDPRFRIEHAQFVQPADIVRFAQLGVIASMQPSHCISDMKWVEKRIGTGAQFSYSWRSMLNNGVALAFGTDWPVEPLNPFLGLYAAVTRQDTAGFPPLGWYPEQRLTVGEAVLAYTAGSAYAVRLENWLGKLLPGFAADFIILDRDIFTVSPPEILQTRIKMTFVNGQQVYAADSF
jgi:predicted amidohydrolase YtcJ